VVIEKKKNKLKLIISQMLEKLDYQIHGYYCDILTLSLSLSLSSKGIFETTFEKITNDLSNSYIASVDANTNIKSSTISMDELDTVKAVILNVKKIVVESLITLSKCKFIDNNIGYKIKVEKICSELKNIENIRNELIDLVKKK
jgi:hypothetical protein